MCCVGAFCVCVCVCARARTHTCACEREREMCVHVCLHICLCTCIGSQVSPWVEGLQTGFQALNLSSQKKVLSLRPAMDFALKNNQIENVTWH